MKRSAPHRYRVVSISSALKTSHGPRVVREPVASLAAPVVGILELVGCLPRRLFIFTLHRAGQSGTLFGLTPSTKRGKRARRTGHNVSTASDICDCVQLTRDGHQTGVHSRSHNVTQSHYAEMAVHVGGLRRFRAPIQSNPPTMIRSRALDAAIH